VNREISPPTMPAPAANYAHGVLVEHPERWVYTAGVVPVAPDGSVPDDVREQADTVWGNIGLILAEAGMTPSDIVSVTTYVVAGNDLGAVMQARDHALGGHRAASTLIPVPALARPQWKVEIAVVAAR
jgi:enamine deaminase RidA (YjgF/YER057c/UK114 family)